MKATRLNIKTFCREFPGIAGEANVSRLLEEMAEGEIRFRRITHQVLSMTPESVHYHLPSGTSDEGAESTVLAFNQEGELLIRFHSMKEDNNSSLGWETSVSTAEPLGNQVACFPELERQIEYIVSLLDKWEGTTTVWGELIVYKRHDFDLSAEAHRRRVLALKAMEREMREV